MLDAQELSHDVEDEQGVDGQLGGIAGQRLTSLEGHFEFLQQVDGNFLGKESLAVERLHLGLMVQRVKA